MALNRSRSKKLRCIALALVAWGSLHCLPLSTFADDSAAPECWPTLAQIRTQWAAPGPTAQRAFAIETPAAISEALREAHKVTDAEVAAGRLPSAQVNRDAYLERLSEEYARLRAQDRALQIVQAQIAQGRVDPTDAQALAAARERARQEVLQTTHKDRVLFIDTPVLGKEGQTLNQGMEVTFVIDHHGAYAPANPLDNSGAQVLARLRQAAIAETRDGVIDTQAALKRFHRDLYGNNPGRIVLSADNLADAAEVMAILRSPELQRRIIADPSMVEMLAESGRFTDIFIFQGDAYEKAATSDSSRLAIALSKAHLQSHSELLREYFVSSGDRLFSEATADPAVQRKLQTKAVRRSEPLLLEATAAHGTGRPYNEIEKKAAEFDAWRGGPKNLVQANGKPTSFAKAQQAHATFSAALPKTLEAQLRKELPPDQARAESLRLAQKVDALFFGHGSISTGHQFADWAASPMANAYHPKGQRPIKLELGGSGEERGKLVIVAKAGQKPVDLTAVAQALNAANDAQKKTEYQTLIRQGVPAEQASEQVNKYSGFTARGQELVTNFGGHALSRAQVQLVIAQTVASTPKPLVIE